MNLPHPSLFGAFTLLPTAGSDWSGFDSVGVDDDNETDAGFVDDEDMIITSLEVLLLSLLLLSLLMIIG